MARVAAKATVLVVEDERAVAQLLTLSLRREGYRVLASGAPARGLAMARRTPPDLAILDIGLPGMDGFELARRLRDDRPVPILFLSARGTEVDKVVGFKLGADDYVTKPFSMPELLCRVEALLRRLRPADRSAKDGSIAVGGIQADFERRELRVRGRLKELSTSEFVILELLFRARGKVLKRKDIISRLWGSDGEDIETRSVDQHVARLRRKLGPEGSRISTVRGLGYKIRSD